MNIIAKLRELHERRNTSGSFAAENLAAADMAYPALLAIAEAAEKLRHIQATRDYDDAESAASGLTFSIGDLSNAEAELDAALDKLEEVEL